MELLQPVTVIHYMWLWCQFYKFYRSAYVAAELLISCVY